MNGCERGRERNLHIQDFAENSKELPQCPSQYPVGTEIRLKFVSLIFPFLPFYWPENSMEDFAYSEKLSICGSSTEYRKDFLISSHFYLVQFHVMCD